LSNQRLLDVHAPTVAGERHLIASGARVPVPSAF
jgi:hypothetical protein